MQNPEIHSVKKDQRFKKLLVPISIVSIILLSVLFFWPIRPHYIVIPIPAPEDSYDLVGWGSTTYSKIMLSSGLNNPAGKYYIWRRDATLAYQGTDKIPSWESLVNYFDEQLSKKGWEKSNTSIPCNIFLPEAAFLTYGENGFVSYYKINDMHPGDEISEDSVVCLAIWNDKGYSNVFRVVILTSEKSFFTKVFSVFDR
jgi:hypothetical protein